MIKTPAPSTLARYGLSEDEWRSILMHDADGRPVCAVCGRVLERSVIDHEHVRGWKQMEDTERKKYVRGVTCPSCNHFVLTRYADADKHRKAADYLDAYRRKQLGDVQDELPAVGPAVRRRKPSRKPTVRKVRTATRK